MAMFLDETRVAELLTWEKLIAAMEQALAEFSQGRVLQPVRQMLTIEAEERYLGIMPAVAEEAMGLKLVSFYPKNAGTAVPTHMAMILLFRPQTGEPLAVMDGRLITEMRTAARAARGHGRAAHHRDAYRRGFGGGDKISCAAGYPCPGIAR
jgi:thiomorpholine-carboxylate dehydrogenase